MTFSCLKYHFFLEVKIKVTTFVVAKTPCYAFDCSGCSTVGSAPRSGRGGRKFESSHPDKNKESTIWIVDSLFFVLEFLWLCNNDSRERVWMLYDSEILLREDASFSNCWGVSTVCFCEKRSWFISLALKRTALFNCGRIIFFIWNCCWGDLALII